MLQIPNIDADLPVLDPKDLPVLPGSQPTAAAIKAANRHTRRVARRRFLTLTKHGHAVEHLRPLPGPYESIHAVMNGRFSGWDIATAVIELLAERVDELTVSTLGFSRQNMESVVSLLDRGSVGSLLLNVSNYFQSTDRKIFADIQRQLESRGQRVGVTRSHAKLMLFRTATRNIVVETSGNLRGSMSWEQFSVADDAELLDFHRGWIEALIEETQAQ